MSKKQKPKIDDTGDVSVEFFKILSKRAVTSIRQATESREMNKLKDLKKASREQMVPVNIG